MLREREEYDANERYQINKCPTVCPLENNRSISNTVYIFTQQPSIAVTITGQVSLLLLLLLLLVYDYNFSDALSLMGSFVPLETKY